MVNYMVGLDLGPTGKAAFFTALRLMSAGVNDGGGGNKGSEEKTKDHLYMLCIVRDVGKYASKLPVDTMEGDKRSCRHLLKIYGRICQERGIPYTSIIAIAAHAGEMICQAVEKKKIDFLILGRRRTGMDKFKRFLMGSTSKYCLKNAHCKVIVVPRETRLTPAEELEFSTARMREQSPSSAPASLASSPRVSPSSSPFTSPKYSPKLPRKNPPEDHLQLEVEDEEVTAQHLAAQKQLEHQQRYGGDPNLYGEMLAKGVENLNMEGQSYHPINR